MLDTGIVSTQKKMWQLVSKDMLKKNYYFTPAQCENKWKTLKRTYRSKLDRYGSKRHYPFKKYEILQPIKKFSSSFKIYSTVISLYCKNYGLFCM